MKAVVITRFGGPEELVDRSFRPKQGRNGKIHQLTLMVFLRRRDRHVGRNLRYPPTGVGGICAKPCRDAASLFGRKFQMLNEPLVPVLHDVV